MFLLFGSFGTMTIAKGGNELIEKYGITAQFVFAAIMDCSFVLFMWILVLLRKFKH